MGLEVRCPPKCEISASILQNTIKLFNIEKSSFDYNFLLTEYMCATNICKQTDT